MGTDGSPAFFREEGGVFFGNDPARGPWSTEHCHAGPVTGLVVRAAEAAAGPEKVLTRLTLDVVRPIPLTGIRVAVEVERASRTLTTTRVEVLDLDRARCVSGTSMHLVRKDLGEVPNVSVDGPDFTQAEVVPYRLIDGVHGAPNFGHFIDIALPRGTVRAPGPKTIWMRVPPILEGEAPTPIQSICPLADCGNGISWNALPDVLGFMNTDLTLQMHREPVSDWMASEAVSHWQGNGVGMSHSVLYDTQGPVGVALQTLVLHPPRPR